MPFKIDSKNRFGYIICWHLFNQKKEKGEEEEEETIQFVIPFK
jgi:hypothetical protein